MSLYIIVGILLFFGSLIEYTTKKTYAPLYSAMFFGLLLMLCLRFGQGTDYFAYQYIYENVPATLNIVEIAKLTTSVHSEIGWKLLCAFSKIIGLNYYVFSAIIGAITMFLLDRFIKKFCPLKITALFIAYPTLYLTYIFSGMRQALVLCFFLGVLLDLYLQKKYTRFLMLVLLASLLHTAALILIVIIIIPLKDFFMENQTALIFLSWLVGIAFAIFSFNIVIFGRTFTNEVTSISYLAVAERIVTYIFIQIIYKSYKRLNLGNTEFLDTIFFLFGICMVLYGILFSMPTVASRICYFFKCMEIILITTMLNHSRKIFPMSTYLYVYVSILAMVMLLKNIDSYISQGMYYYEYSNVLTFPYNNIFVKGTYRYSLHQNLIN